MDQRIRLTKKLLKESLIEMLKTESIYRISIRELCQKAGINRSTFYKHYENQFDLLSEMEQDLMDNIGVALTDQVEHSRNALVQILSYLESDIEFSRMLFNSNVDPNFPKKLFSMKKISDALGILTADMDKNEAEYYTRFVLFGAYEIIHTWLNKDKRESLEWISSMLLKFILESQKSLAKDM